MTHLLPIAILAGASMLNQAQSARPAPTPDLQALARVAIEGEFATLNTADPVVRRAAGRAAALEKLRDAGQAGVDALAPLATTPEAKAALDKVCGQYDCSTTRLFWFTDVAKAKAESAATGKPILQLRLLGRLDEQFSCANSRFFRTTLYPRPEVSSYLRANYVLFWETVRAVPRVTIDFGDGRKLERTLTGNSIHFVLDSRGRPVDGIPGLYGAAAFLEQLTRIHDLAVRVGPLDDAKRLALLKKAHQIELEAATARLNQEMKNSGVASAGTALADPLDVADDVIERIASQHQEPVEVLAGDPKARKKFSSAYDAGRLAVSKAVVEMPILRQSDTLRRSVSQDGVKNEYVLHRKLHRLFAEGSVGPDATPLNERVYRELFLMPLDDPWLGLSPDDGFTGF